MATIKEIAKACGVSVATVSNILNKKPGASEATRNLVLKTAKEMNYMHIFFPTRTVSQNMYTAEFQLTGYTLTAFLSVAHFLRQRTASWQRCTRAMP